ncbi:hypothetical protein [Aliarcobacter butzleri]|uniref:Uncharacterized protein n=1 Tax=Aliarcobacter butzleri TaxID=28197 RepID=A0AAW7Q248_9BACT|nr:hypothetical protein [Aliarcobacter butzleri]MDN5113143.1 hypothetical protein [Aliarcobacter butzleri]
MISEFSTTDYKVEFKSATRSKAKWGEQFMINNLYLLIKFGEQQYMQDLYENGTLFFRKVKKFRNDDNIQREDKNEGISHSLQLSRFTMYVNGKKFSLSDNGYVSIDHYPNIDFLSYSMYALTTEHFKVKDGIYIDTRNFEFGDTCVIIKDINEFYKRIQKYMQKLSLLNMLIHLNMMTKWICLKNIILMSIKVNGVFCFMTLIMNMIALK